MEKTKIEIETLKVQARHEHDTWVADHQDGGYMSMWEFCPCGAPSIPLRTDTPWPAHDALKAAQAKDGSHVA